jgi:O-antigen ligase
VGQFALLDALVLALTGAGWFVLLIAIQPSARNFSWMLVISGTVVAGIAVLQVFGADLFAASGWIPATGGNARMRVFATLGNPDYVAAFLTGLVPLTFSLASETPRARRWGFGLCVLQGAAIVATGSRAPILGIAAAALWTGWLRARRVMVGSCVIAACVVLIAATISPARSITTTSQGRLYIWKVSFPHLGEHWVSGLGPGGFAALFPAWEIQYWRGLGENSDRKFAGLQDHAHKDYLEMFANSGTVGLFSFLSVLVLFLRTVAKRRHEIDSVLVGASAGVVAFAAVAFVDFPLARPAEVFLFWSLIAITFVGELPSRQASRS